MTAGVVDGLPDAEYRRNPALSQSGAKLLLPPSCPAIYRYQRDNPPPSKPHFDMGHAAHKMVLGVGAEIRTVDAKDWRSKAAQQARDEAHVIGEIPLLISESETLQGMIDALREHPLAMALLDPANGKAEQSLFAHDDESGVDLRGRLDWLPNPRNGRLLLVDYKTTVSANPDLFAKSAANYFYHGQDSWYRDLVIRLGLDDDPAFLFVAQEKTPPYLVSVVELDADAKRIGAQLNRQAIDIFAECSAKNEWPGYSSDVEQISLPYWYVKSHEQDTAA